MAAREGIPARGQATMQSTFASDAGTGLQDLFSRPAPRPLLGAELGAHWVNPVISS